MNAGIIERDATAGQTLRAPAIPDLTLPQFVLGAAHRRGSKPALVDAATGRELSYAGLADAVREAGAGLCAGRASGRRARPVRAELHRVRRGVVRGHIDRRDCHDREPAVHGG